MAAYYNECDRYAAAWLRALISAGAIAPGDVDERSIVDVRPADLGGYAQCHFFAGIGGWSYALRLAGWPDDRPVWTGSCPCQPFSSAGKADGADDPRHLWPAWERLIAECRPAVVFGEQVASVDGLAWLDLVCADLEGAGYAVGAADLGAAGVGAPHIRQRLYFVADTVSAGPAEGRTLAGNRQIARGGGNGLVADAEGEDGQVSVRARGSRGAGAESGRAGGPRELADGDGPRRGSGRDGGTGDGGDAPRIELTGLRDAGPEPWTDVVWLPCRDGKWRPTQPGLFPLAHGVPGRVGLLRGYGNAIVPQVGAAFIRAYLEVI
jgi:DNA (cytosine-5)-methyltransferase 1